MRCTYICTEHVGTGVPGTAESVVRVALSGVLRSCANQNCCINRLSGADAKLRVQLQSLETSNFTLVFSRSFTHTDNTRRHVLVLLSLDLHSGSSVPELNE